MKRIKSLSLIIIFVLMIFVSKISFAQAPPPPPSTPEGHGLAGNKDPGKGSGAPIGDGLYLLVGLAIGFYGVKYIIGSPQSKKKENLSVLSN